MLASGEYEERKPIRYWATILLLAANIAAYCGQVIADRYGYRLAWENYFALTQEGIRHGYLWQLITFQFLHGNIWHIVINCWVIYIFGRVIEVSLGWRRMLRLYLLSGLIGGVIQVLGMWFLPTLLPDALVLGASAGAAGLVAAFAVLYPRETLVLFLFYVIPVKMRAKTMLWFFIVVSVVGIFYPLLQRFIPSNYFSSAMFGNVAHAAHLGGVIAGWIQARRMIRRPPPQPIIEPPKAPLNITAVGD